MCSLFKINLSKNLLSICRKLDVQAAGCKCKTKIFFYKPRFKFLT